MCKSATKKEFKALQIIKETKELVLKECPIICDT